VGDRPSPGTDETGDDTQPSDSGIAVLPRGTLVGRYVLLGAIGEGGMGVVYRAFDPELDRAVAVKLIRSTEPNPEARARLLREAQALARLSHPNVVTVHDVGTFGDQVFVAMELLAGQPLSAWLTAPRSWREIVRAFADAGRGLAAAHRAGLVHRDFKPSNAFVVDGGGVRLLDFGLARAAADRAGPPVLPFGDDRTPTPTPVATPSSGLHASVTRIGVVQGTPRYMAPEQRAGDVTQRSDQYAFCVSLVEALYHVRPRPDLPERELRGPGPRRLRPLLARGLRARPGERWPSMDALVDALDRLVVGRRAIGFALGAAVAVAIASVSFVLGTGHRAGARDRCVHAGAAMDAIWTPAKADALRAAFATTGRPYAVDTATRVVSGLDRYAASWRAARGDACEATWVRGEQSAALLDRRMACLDRRLAALRAYVHVMTDARAELVDRAVAGLPAPTELATCSTLESLEASGPWSPSATSRPEIAQLEAMLEDAWSMRFAARYDRASQIARDVRARASAIPWPPLVAEAVFTLGAIQQAAGDAAAARDTLDQAITLAAEAHHLPILARASVLQVYVVGDLLGHSDEAMGLATLARAEIRLAGDPPRTLAALSNNLGNVYLWRGRYDDAYREYVTDLAISLPLLGSDHVDVAWSWSNLGRVLQARGAFGDARRDFERAVAIAEHALGAQHPDVAPFLNNLARVLIEQGDTTLARSDVDRGISLVAATVGRDHRRVAELLLTRALIDDAEGHHADALRACDEALAIDAPKVDPAHLAIGLGLACRGRALVGLGRAAEATPVLERALAIIRAQTNDPAETAAVQAPLARARWQQGDHAHALELATAARTAYRAAPGHSRALVDLDRWLTARGGAP
jgi:eukaryotic-like serine/threonine-protein kinase